MSLNINAGELRHLIEFYVQGEGSDGRGRPVAKTLAFDPVMGDLRYKSGDQIRNSGAQLTDEVITVLTWYDPRVTNAMFIKYNNLNNLILSALNNCTLLQMLRGYKDYQ